MQHLQYGNYDIRYMVYVRKMADINVLFLNLNTIFKVLFTIYIPTINAVPSVHVVQ